MLHIGYVYEPDWNPPNATDFHPAYRKGARLAHAWINPLTPCVNKLPQVNLSYLSGDLPDDKIATWTYSTLDVVPPTSYAFIFAKGSPWASNAAQLKAQLAAQHVPIVLVEVGTDFEFVEPAAGQEWLEGFSLTSGSAVLVRPDQHVAVVADTTQSVDDVTDTILAGLKV